MNQIDISPKQPCQIIQTVKDHTNDKKKSYDSQASWLNSQIHPECFFIFISVGFAFFLSILTAHSIILTTIVSEEPQVPQNQTKTMKLHMYFFKLVSLLILLVSVVPGQGRIFEYMPNCHGLEYALDDYINECRHLADAAKDAVDNIGDNFVAQKLVTVYFSIHFVKINGRTVARHEDWEAWSSVKSKS